MLFLLVPPWNRRHTHTHQDPVITPIIKHLQLQNQTTVYRMENGQDEKKKKSQKRIRGAIHVCVWDDAVMLVGPLNIACCHWTVMGSKSGRCSWQSARYS